MRTNGFIFMTLGFAAVALAGSPGYLPSVGPVALRFETPPSKVVRSMTVPLPVANPPVTEAPLARSDLVADIPVEPPTAPTPPAVLLHDVPVVVTDAMTGSTTNALESLIGPMMETNSVVTPQMFLRFFTPVPGGGSREAIVIPPPGFNPAQPPSPSSTATYTKPKP